MTPNQECVCTKADDIAEIKTDVRWIRENLIAGTKKMADHETRIRGLERESTGARFSVATILKLVGLLGVTVSVIAAILKFGA